MSQELATSICKTLFDAGYIAYFAGGFVRDLLLGCTPEEIDIATSAPPPKIQELFPKTIPVGVAFGVVIVVLEGINFEVTTFRKDHPYHDGRHPEGVDFSTPEKDAMRRDFTINGLFFDPLTQEIYDYVKGQEDLKKGVIRAIGDPEHRFFEDRLRMIRAVRFAARFNFCIEKKTEEAIKKHASSLFPSVSIERVWQEFSKMAAYPRFDQALVELKRLYLLEVMLPQLKGTEIEKSIAPFPYFPFRCPPVIYLLELLPQTNLEERLKLADYLKLSNKERKHITFFTEAAIFFQKSLQTPYEWAHFYAHEDAELFLHVQAAKLLPKRRESFLKKHQKRKRQLKPHIQRIQQNRLIITASMLMENGIKPGKKMGILLKKAEEIAINEDILDQSIIIERLLK